MGSIVGLLDLGRNALLAHQKSIHTAGHNIANVNTPGYSRQRVNLAANQAVSGAPGQIGTGVTAMEIQRIYDQLVEAQIYSEQQTLGRWEAREYALERVEMNFDEASGEGLQQAMNEFWNSWQYLTDNPEGYPERAALLSNSEFLATSFNRTAAGLVKQQVELDFSIAGAVEEINQIANQIANLNRKIGEIEISGQNANDLHDQQTLLLNDLATLIDFQTFEDDLGRVSVLVGEGRPLVQGYNASQLTTQTNAQGHLDVFWIDGGGNAFDITPQTNGGRLGGWLEVRDVEIVDYLNRLDTMAQTLLNEVNALHTAGFDLQGNPGEVFFTGGSAADIAVNTVIVSDPNRIAAATSAAGAPGDGGNALSIAGLQHTLIMGGGTATLDDFYRALVTDVGSAVQAASAYHSHQTAVTASLDNYRESISGVSLEEEMVNLIKFQHAFDAAAKLVTTVDEMIDTVMTMTR